MPRILPIVAIVIGSLSAPAAVIAQTAPTAPRSPDSPKTIGVPSWASTVFCARWLSGCGRHHARSKDCLGDE
jgi:hypothetical protein